jgi:predicted AAA+ superfamily ATPase
VLGELQARFLPSAMFYWRDKQKHEVDFILKARRGSAVVAIECKASATGFDPAGMTAFRRRHPSGTNILVCLDAPRRSVRKVGNLELEIVPYSALGRVLDDVSAPEA